MAKRAPKLSGHRRLYNHDLPLPRSARLVVGLYGGSFNPAHAGHRHVSEQALKRLRLDRLWWLVSPQNPLKPTHGMADFQTRMAIARRLAKHPRITVTDLEARLGSRFSFETIAALQRLFPHIRFVWLMGADNWAGFHRWQRWRGIIRRVPIVVADRPAFSLRAARGRAALRYWRSRCRHLRQLAQHKAPAWSMLWMPRHPLSATILRKRLGKRAFLRHNDSK